MKYEYSDHWNEKKNEILHVRSTKKIKDMIEDLKSIEIKQKYYTEFPFKTDGETVDVAVKLLYFLVFNPEVLEEVKKHYKIPEKCINDSGS